MIEKTGLISRELLAIVDMILRVKSNDECFGGVFIILNGDTNQLPNIEGSKGAENEHKTYSRARHSIKYKCNT